MALRLYCMQNRSIHIINIHIPVNNRTFTKHNFHIQHFHNHFTLHKALVNLSQKEKEQIIMII